MSDTVVVFLKRGILFTDEGETEVLDFAAGLNVGGDADTTKSLQRTVSSRRQAGLCPKWWAGHVLG